MSIRPRSTVAREGAAWMAIGALTCLAGCSRTSQPDRSPPSTPQALEAIVRDFADQHRLPGLAAGVWRRGEVILRMGVGNQDGPGSPPIDGETVFHLASVTKPFVATAVMQLVAADKMCLDCPLQRYLPYFSMQGPGAERITIRQLLTHTAGTGDTSDFGWTTPEYDDGAVERYVRSLASVRLDFVPGSEWRYSNRGFDVLADAIAKADGQAFETVIQQRILTPLGMRRSTLLMSDIDSARMARGHRRDGRAVGYYPYNRRHAGSSTLHSTLDDMLRWAAVNLGRGSLHQRRILPTTAYEELWHPYWDIRATIAEQTRRAGYVFPYDSLAIGLSWFLPVQDGRQLVYHSGSDPGFASAVLLSPSEQIGVVVLINASGADPRALSRSLLDAARR
ncbi:MAG TPA: serine hydrolase domain-containing protein [Gemmatimonadaceae bacterium]|nr:serine hydrolase domain-containing protein [Gemmatimonadaceae bacterium]